MKRIQKKQALSCAAVLLLLVSSNLSAATTATPIQDQETLRRTVQTVFGPTVAPVTGFNPFFLTGDFNGDGAQDVVIVVRLSSGRSALAKDVRVGNPFGYGAIAANAETLALAIIHGGKGGWQTSPPVGKFVLLGESPVLILQSARTASADESGDLMSLKRKRARRMRGDPWPPAAARGDAIVLATEATDSILYWDGKTYRWKEAAGGE